MTKFGNTNPCANVAKHFEVPQAYVDHVMEWVLYEAKIRTKAPGTEHADRLAAMAREIPFDTRIGVERALDIVALDILEDARRRRAAAA